MADRQWFLTKFVGAALSLLLIVSTCMGAANMFFDLKRDVRDNTTDITDHKTDDAGKWDKLYAITTGHSSDITALEKREISRNGEYASLRKDLERYEATQQLILAELKRLERSQ